MVTVKEFIEVYNDWDITIRKAMKILGISRYEWDMLRDYCFKEGLLTEKRRKGRKRQVMQRGRNGKPKYYLWNRRRRKWEVRKSNIYYATFNTKEECEVFVELMSTQFDWDKSKVPIVKELMN